MEKGGLRLMNLLAGAIAGVLMIGITPQPVSAQTQTQTQTQSTPRTQTQRQSQTQLQTTVNGVVRDNTTRMPLEGATIRIYNDSDSLLRSVSSDALGRFSVNLR